MRPRRRRRRAGWSEDDALLEGTKARRSGSPDGRDANDGAGALAGRALDLQLRAVTGGALAHRAQAEVAREVAARIEADAVVDDAELDPVRAFGQTQLDAA